MGHALGGSALAQAHGPFALDRGIDQTFPPERRRNAQMAGADLVKEFPRQIGDGNGCDGADRMIDLAQDKHVEIADIAGQEERDDLAPTVLKLLVAAGPTGENETHILGLAAFTGNIDARPEVANPLRGSPHKNGAVRRRQPDKMLELSNEVAQRNWLP